MTLKQLLNVLHQSHQCWNQRVLSESAAVELERLRSQAHDDARYDKDISNSSLELR